eukprot:647899-Pyramimonas_sp.AAC.1
MQLMQFATGWRLAKGGPPHATAFYNRRNAFGSVSLQAFDDADMARAAPGVVGVGAAFNRESRVAIDAQGGQRHLQVNEGVLEGHQSAPSKYIRTFART